MIPMIDTMVPGLGTAMMIVSPSLVGVGIALIAGVAFMVRGAAEELRRQAVRDFEARAIRTAAGQTDRIAA